MNRERKPGEAPTWEAEQALTLLCEALDLSNDAAIFFAVCESEATCQQRMREVRQHLEAQGREVLEMELSPKQPDLATQIGGRTDTTPPLRVGFVVMRGLEEAGMEFPFLPEDAPLRRRAEEASRVLRTLNLERERLRERGWPLVFWLNRSTLGQVIQQAADLFAARSGIFYLDELPPLTEIKGMVTLEITGRERGHLRGLPSEELKRRAGLYENRLQRERTAEKPNLPGIALLCQELAAIYSALGERERASTFQQQATDLYRGLAHSSPQAFLPALAASLNNLGAMLSDLGRREEALRATEEAVAHYRDLAAANPPAFLPDLAMSLNNLGAMLSALGRREEALAAYEEAVRTLLPFFRAYPQAFRDWMQTMRDNYLRACRALGREPDGELVESLRKLLGKM